MKKQTVEQIEEKSTILMDWLNNGDINISQYVRAKSKLDRIPFEKCMCGQSRVSDEDIQKLLQSEVDPQRC